MNNGYFRDLTSEEECEIYWINRFKKENSLKFMSYYFEKLNIKSTKLVPNRLFGSYMNEHGEAL
jgi:hypothetical protein